MNRETRLWSCCAAGIETSKVTVIHTARTVDELALAAPLLQYPETFDLQLHFTGNQAAITSSSIPQPVPPPSAGGGRSSDSGDQKIRKTAPGKDLESGLSDSGSSGFTDLMRLTPMEHKWESLFVWCMCFFLGWWLLVRLLVIFALFTFHCAPWHGITSSTFLELQ